MQYRAYEMQNAENLIETRISYDYNMTKGFIIAKLIKILLFLTCEFLNKIFDIQGVRYKINKHLNFTQYFCIVAHLFFSHTYCNTSQQIVTDTDI